MNSIHNIQGTKKDLKQKKKWNKRINFTQNVITHRNMILSTLNMLQKEPLDINIYIIPNNYKKNSK